ncbi:hypothetical protein L810_5047 [Burkholderia sp. AU4i]|nr:hypothetical protein L810_5047 [Burkholderia sp. AU4i]
MVTPTDTIFEYAPPRCWYATSHVQFGLRSLSVRISVMVIRRFGERDQFGRWCCAVNGL